MRQETIFIRDRNGWWLVKWMIKFRMPFRYTLFIQSTYFSLHSFIEVSIDCECMIRGFFRTRYWIIGKIYFKQFFYNLFTFVNKIFIFDLFISIFKTYYMIDHITKKLVTVYYFLIFKIDSMGYFSLYLYQIVISWNLSKISS